MGVARREELKKLETRLGQAPQLVCRTCSEGGILEYYRCCVDFVRLQKSVWQEMVYIPSLAKMLDPGRLVVVSRGRELRNVVAVVLKCFTVEGVKKRLKLLLPVKSVNDTSVPSDSEEAETFEENLRLWDLAIDKNRLFAGVENCGNERHESPHCVAEFPVECLVGICAKSLKVQGNEVVSDWERRKQPRFRNSSPEQTTLIAVKELRHWTLVWRTSVEGPPLVDSGKDLQSAGVDLVTRVHDLKALGSQLKGFRCTQCLSFKEHFMQIRDLDRMQSDKQKLQYLLSPESLRSNAAYKDKLAVLKHLGYVDVNNMVELKGKVACEISQHEILMTELILENVFSSLAPAEVAAVLSITTCQFKTKDVELNEHMTKLKEVVMRVVDKISSVQKMCGVGNYDLSDELQFGLMEVVYEWARGIPFAQLMEMTEAQEGLIVRCIQRLDEMCRDVMNAARIVGDPNLQQKMEETSQAIKRDIVFAASLYTTIS